MNIVHIGVERTGNTTLQNTLFSVQKSFTYIGARDDLYPNEKVRELILRISTQDSIDYDAASAKNLLQQIRDDDPPPRPVLFASERLSLDGGADRALIATRLHGLLAPAKVLILIRAQTTIVQAQYAKYISMLEGRRVSFEEWLEQIYGDIEFYGPFRLGLDYDPLVKTYEDIFGFDNVTVLPSELLHEDNSSVQAAIADLLDIPLQSVRDALSRNVADQRISRRLNFARRVQHLLPSDQNLALLGRRLLPPFAYEPIRRFVVGGAKVDMPALPEPWRDRISHLCAEGNAHLESRRNLPLRNLGYPV